MFKLWRILPILLLTLAFAAFRPAIQAQADPTAMSGQTREEKIAQGELIKVDTDHMTLTIKNVAGDEIEFHYNSDTKVEGSTNGVQGLSTQTGTRLTIHYKEQSEDDKLATKIEIVK